jgi:hypothetical protein
MDIETKQVRQLAGHIAGAMEQLRVLLTRHDLGPLAVGAVSRAEDALVLARAIVAPAVERANEIEAQTQAQIDRLRAIGDVNMSTVTVPIDEQFGTFG